MTRTAGTKITPIDITTWHRKSAGCYVNAAGTLTIMRVELDDGQWWVIVDETGHSGDPHKTYRDAKAAVAAEHQGPLPLMDVLADGGEGR